MRCPDCGSKMRYVASDDDVPYWLCEACGYTKQDVDIEDFADSPPLQKVIDMVNKRGSIRGRAL